MARVDSTLRWLKTGVVFFSVAAFLNVLYALEYFVFRTGWTWFAAFPGPLKDVSLVSTLVPLATCSLPIRAAVKALAAGERVSERRPYPPGFVTICVLGGGLGTIFGMIFTVDFSDFAEAIKKGDMLGYLNNMNTGLATALWSSLVAVLAALASMCVDYWWGPAQSQSSLAERLAGLKAAVTGLIVPFEALNRIMARVFAAVYVLSAAARMFAKGAAEVCEQLKQLSAVVLQLLEHFKTQEAARIRKFEDEKNAEAERERKAGEFKEGIVELMKGLVNELKAGNEKLAALLAENSKQRNLAGETRAEVVGVRGDIQAVKDEVVGARTELKEAAGAFSGELSAREARSARFLETVAKGFVEVYQPDRAGIALKENVHGSGNGRH